MKRQASTPRQRSQTTYRQRREAEKGNRTRDKRHAMKRHHKREKRRNPQYRRRS